MAAFISFWLTVSLLGLAVLPITQRLFRHLPDRGYVFAKTLGLLLVSYLVWILATLGLLGNSGGSLLIIAALLAILAWRKNGQEALNFLKKSFNYVILIEFLFFTSLAIFTLLRIFGPELTGGEKPMDLAFMNSILRSERFPPQDPWFAHFPINYYYFGHLMMATLAKLSGLKMAIAFNLEVALVFALATIGVFGLIFDLIFSSEKMKPLRPWRKATWWPRHFTWKGGVSLRKTVSFLLHSSPPTEGRGILKREITKRGFPRRPLFFGLLAAAVMILGGNFEVFLEILSLHGVGGAEFWEFIDIPGLAPAAGDVSWLPIQTGWWWRASRIIPTAITEFPYFSLLFGDLHAHVLALPLTILAVGLALNELRGGLAKFSLLRLLLVALCLGSLGFANTWDLPVYFTLWAVTLVLGQFLVLRRVNFLLVKRVLLHIIIVAGLAFILFAPYYLSGSRSNIELEFIFAGPRVKLHHFLLQFGLFLPIILLWLLQENLIRIKANVRRIFFFLIFLLIIVTPPLVFHLWLFALLGFLATSALFPLFWLVKHANEENLPEESTIFIFVLLFLIAALAFLSETVYVAGYRGNTIFKFYYAIWLFASLAAGFGAYRLWISLSKARLWLIVIGLVLLLGGLTYPILATRQKLAEPKALQFLTLDGLAFLAKGSPLEYEAIEWLRTSVKGSPVILEIPGQSWSAGSRVSAYTGLPTLVGWIQSEEVLRAKLSKKGVDFPELYQRLADIDLIYGTGDEKTTLALLAKHQVRYVYVGALERQKYGETVQKFSRYLKPVFQNDQVVIYENTNL